MWGTLSNALVKSDMAISTVSFLSRDLEIILSWIVWINCVSVDLWARNPCWESLKIIYLNSFGKRHKEAFWYCSRHYFELIERAMPLGIDAITTSDSQWRQIWACWQPQARIYIIDARQLAIAWILGELIRIEHSGCGNANNAVICNVICNVIWRQSNSWR